VTRTRWVLLAYRLPREPSTPRIGLWRQLRRLGVVQIGDGVVALPLDARTREQLEWLADDVVAEGGDATVWLAEPGSAAQERALAERMAAAVTGDYERVIQAASITASTTDMRTVRRLRRELGRISARDYFPDGTAARAHLVVERLSRALEAAS